MHEKNCLNWLVSTLVTLCIFRSLIPRTLYYSRVFAKTKVTVVYDVDSAMELYQAGAILDRPTKRCMNNSTCKINEF